MYRLQNVWPIRTKAKNELQCLGRNVLKWHFDDDEIQTPTHEDNFHKLEGPRRQLVIAKFPKMAKIQWQLQQQLELNVFRTGIEPCHRNIVIKCLDSGSHSISKYIVVYYMLRCSSDVCVWRVWCAREVVCLRIDTRLRLRLKC